MWQNSYSTNYNPMAGFQDPPISIQPDTSQLLHMVPTQPLAQVVVDAFENFKKSIVGHEEDGDNMVLTVKIPTAMLKQDPNFGFLFK